MICPVAPTSVTQRLFHLPGRFEWYMCSWKPGGGSPGSPPGVSGVWGCTASASSSRPVSPGGSSVTTRQLRRPPWSHEFITSRTCSYRRSRRSRPRGAYDSSTAHDDGLPSRSYVIRLCVSRSTSSAVVSGAMSMVNLRCWQRTVTVCSPHCVSTRNASPLEGGEGEKKGRIYNECGGSHSLSSVELHIALLT